MTSHRIMIIGEAWGDEEERTGRPFTGAAGGVLKGMLRAAEIDFKECYATCVFNLRPSGGQIKSLCGPKSECIPDWPQLGQSQWIRKAFKPELDRLLAEVEMVKPNVIIALGSTPLWALTKLRGIKKQRGTPTLALDERTKILPTYHPSAILRQWKLRPIAIADLAKAGRESTFPEIRRPERFVYIPERVKDIEAFYEEHIAPSRDLGTDIETATIAGIPTITEIGFSPRPDIAMVIPFLTRAPGTHNYWLTAKQEIAAWEWVRRICEEKGLIGQNFNYDMQYILYYMGITNVTVVDDTMILHHSMYPEMEKSLGFLGSIYTDEPAWKFMRADANSFKKEE